MNLKKNIFIIGLLANMIAYNINGLQYSVDGVQEGYQQNISANTLKGAGLIEGTNISIKCDEFQFAGTIRCHGVCKIQAKKSFNTSMFKREGTGTFTVNDVAIDSISLKVQNFTKYHLWKVALVVGVVAVVSGAGYGLVQLWRKGKKDDSNEDKKSKKT